MGGGPCLAAGATALGRQPGFDFSAAHPIFLLRAIAPRWQWLLAPLFADQPFTGYPAMSEPNVIVTGPAARRIAEIVAGEPPGTVLRVAVEGGGCSGFKYRYDLTREVASDDIVIERDGAKVIIDPVSLEYLAGSEIDFVDDLIGASFQIRNPHATSSCGCGTSFAL